MTSRPRPSTRTTPAEPPADDADALDALIRDEGLDVPGATAAFVTPPDAPNSDLGGLDPSEPLVGELPWPFVEDSFVDVYAYSVPVYLGTFPVVGGNVQLSADISALAPGTHRLVFVGQTTQGLQVMEITVQEADGPGGPGAPGDPGMLWEPVTPAEPVGTGSLGTPGAPLTGGASTTSTLARTGVESGTFTPIGIGSVAITLGLGLVVTRIVLRRDRATTR